MAGAPCCGARNCVGPAVGAPDGKGQVVDVAMVDGVANLLSLFHEMLAGGQWKDRRESNLLDGGTPYYRCYACADGDHVAVGALEPQFFARLLDGLGIPQDRYVQHDRAAWPAMTAEFALFFASRTRDDWGAHFIETDAWRRSGAVAGRGSSLPGQS